MRRWGTHPGSGLLSVGCALVAACASLSPLAVHVSAAAAATQSFGLTISPPGTSTTLTGSPAVVHQGGAETLVAVVHSVIEPDGVVSFAVDGVPIPTCERVAVSSPSPNLARCSLIDDVLGSHVVIASYLGSVDTAPSTSNAVTFTVVAPTPPVVVTSPTTPTTHTISTVTSPPGRPPPPTPPRPRRHHSATKPHRKRPRPSRLHLQRGAVLPGQSTVVSGVGCPPGASVVIKIGGQTVRVTTASSQGAFSTSVIPPDRGTGRFAVTATCGTKQFSGSVSIVAPAAASAPEGVAAVFAVFILLGVVLVRGLLGSGVKRRRRRKQEAARALLRRR